MRAARQTLPARYVPFIAHVLRSSYRIARDSDVLPAAFIMYGKEGEPLSVDIVGSVFTGDADQAIESKNGFAEMVRQRASRLQAHAVAMVSEAWSLPFSITEEQLAEHRRKYDSVSANPLAIEVISLTVETYDGNWLGLANLRGKRPQRYCAPPTWFHSPPRQSKGRFTNFLPVKYATPAQVTEQIARLRDKLRSRNINPDLRLHSGTTLIQVVENMARQAPIENITPAAMDAYVDKLVVAARLLRVDLSEGLR